MKGWDRWQFMDKSLANDLPYIERQTIFWRKNLAKRNILVNLLDLMAIVCILHHICWFAVARRSMWKVLYAWGSKHPLARRGMMPCPHGVP